MFHDLLLSLGNKYFIIYQGGMEETYREFKI